ncbi:peptidoglycan-binding protein [Virgibacillus natechei]
MKIRSLMILLVLVFSLFHFSPQIAEATEDEDSSAEKEEAEIEGSGEDDLSVETIDEEREGNEEKTEEPFNGSGGNVNEGKNQSEEDSQRENDTNNEATRDESDAENDEDPEDEPSQDIPAESADTADVGVMSVPYQTADSGEDIVELKQNLTQLGFDDFGTDPDDYYGDEATRVVEYFQEYYGVTNDDVAGEATLAKIEELLSSPYQYGSYDEGNIALKENLNSLGYHVSSNPTIYFGSSTEQAVKDFQIDNGLIVNGIADPNTRATIEELLDGPMYNGIYRDDVVDLKEDLDDLGFHVSSNPTTYYGSSTEKAVSDFQSYYGITGDESGVTGDATLEMIDELLSTPYQNGGYDGGTITLKEDLDNLGFHVSSNPTTYYGSSTEQAVKDFQEKYGLVVNGIADPNTLEKIEELLDGPMYNGLYRNDVVDLKEDLDDLGFHVSSNPTTYYGSTTEQKVSEFQSYYGITGDESGVAGDATLEMIEELLATPYQNGGYDEGTITLKEDLDNLGFHVSSNPTTYYGSSTEQAVRDFQEKYGLVVNEIADQPTWNKIEELLNGPMFNGLYREDVVDLKVDLDKLGFYVSSNPTTYYGSSTEQAVADFQEYYGVTGDESGVAGEATLAKVEELFTSPFQPGSSDERTITLKLKLGELGFHISDNPEDYNPTGYYGDKTEEIVKEFQSHFGLRVNGIADDPTFEEIDAILSSPLQYGENHNDVIQLKEDLKGLGYHVSNNPTDYYGDKTEEQVSQFQADYELPISGIADEITLAKLEDVVASSEVINNTEYNISLAEALAMQLEANPQTDNNYAYVSASWINGNNTVTANVLNVRSGPGAVNSVVGQLTEGTKVNIEGEFNGWYQIEYNSSQWVNASPDDALYYLDPTNFLEDEVQRFQFLDLSKPSNVTSNILNNYLENRGTLSGQGQAFIDASNLYGVSDIYLISHAILETGNGGSRLAQGIEYNGETVFNMYGVGAYDGCAVECGVERAYEQGWFTPYDAIVGGAQFIGNNYIKAGQNTLYEMRWNPAGMAEYGYATHQYATDIGWASKQVSTIYNLYEDLGIFNLVLDIPMYK